MIIECKLYLDEDIIRECFKEIEPTESREEMLARLTAEKLLYYNKLYIEKFNKAVDDLYESAINENVVNMSILLNRLSKALYKVQKSEMALFKSLRYDYEK